MQLAFHMMAGGTPSQFSKTIFLFLIKFSRTTLQIDLAASIMAAVG